MEKRILPLLMMLLAGCSQPVSKSTRYVVFVDGSISPGDQSPLWVGAVEARVCKPLDRADTLEVLAIGVNTAEYAPLFEAAIPDPPRGMSGDLQVRRAKQDICARAIQVVRSTLTAASERQTRLLDSIPRIPRDPLRRVQVLYLTDAIEASPELDLDRVALGVSGAPASLARRVVDQRDWPAGLLEGAVIDFVLDSPARGARPHANARADIQRFWVSLFSELGATVRSFDARVGGVAGSR